jgi:hypothetical protein
VKRFAILAALAAIVLGIAGLAVTTERASAQLPPHDTRFDLECQQVVDPVDNDGIGVVVCKLIIDVPDFASPPLPDTLKLIIEITYFDRDGNNRPSRGDIILCIKVSTPDGKVLIDRCRPDVLPTPTPPSPPDSL